MREGLLWFDNSRQRKLADKVSRAATRYQAKFGYRPTVCYLNAADLEAKVEEVNGIRLQAEANVLRHHFLIGVDQDSAVPQAA